MASTIRDEWEKAVADQQSRLQKKRYEGLLQQLDYDSFQTAVAEADRHYRKRNIVRQMQSVSPALRHLQSFITAITTMTAARPDSVGLIWGGIQVVIVLASKFTTIMERITSMIKDLTEDLNMLHEYLILFPDNDTIGRCMRCIIYNYVGFCISALKFFTRLPTYTLIRLFWRTLDQKFENARGEIQESVKKFANAKQLAFERELIENTRRIEAAFPATVIRPSQPEHLYEVPYSRNPRFCGRDDVLSTLHQFLVKNIGPRRPSRTTGQLSSCIIYGMGGVGKTQVAIEYSYRYRDSYDFIFWIHAENESVLLSSMTKLSSDLNLKMVGNATNKDVVVECVRKWLEKTEKRWLLVFDNAEIWSILEPCMPRATHGAVLITSQDDQLGQLVAEEIHLRPLNTTEGSELILKHLPKAGATYNVEDAKRISAQLGGLPLALGYAAGHISKTKWSLEEFLRFFEERQISASIFSMPAPTTTHQYEKSLEMVWEVSLQRLEPDQRKLIQILSMLNPDGIPENMLYTVHQEPELAFLSSAGVDVYNFGTMIGDLASRHLVSRETVAQEARLLVHRSLQKSVLHSLDKDPKLFQRSFRLAFTLIRKVYPKQSPTHDPQNEQWKIQELYQPHILSLHSVYAKSLQRPKISIDFAELLSDAVYYFWERGMLRDGVSVMDTAEEICDIHPQGSYMIKANVYSLGAVVRWSRGLTQRAPILRRFVKALALLQRLVNDLNPGEATPEILRLYATSWNDVGHIFIEYEYYEDAIECLDLCAAIKGGLGDELGVLGAGRNKALALVWLGRFSEASELVPDMGNILPDLLEPRCASYYERCRFAWANILVMTGNLKAAYELLQQNLDSRKRLCGKAGVSTLGTYYLLGITQYKMGNIQEAIGYFEKALGNSAEWSDESKAVAKYHLSKAFADIGEDKKAHNLSEEADAARKRLWNQYATYLDEEGGRNDETYDHLISSEMGRTTIGKFQTSGKLPKLMGICRDIQEKIKALGGGPMLPSQCCLACKSPDIDVSEAEHI